MFVLAYKPQNMYIFRVLVNNLFKKKIYIKEKKKINVLTAFFISHKSGVNHCTPLVQWLLYKYKCLWGVGGKGQGSSL